MTSTDPAIRQLVADRIADLHTTAGRVRTARRSSGSGFFGRRTSGRRSAAAGAAPAVSSGAIPGRRPPIPFTDEFAVWASTLGAGVADAGVTAFERHVAALVKLARRHGVTSSAATVLGDRNALPAPRERALGIVLVALTGTARTTTTATPMADRDIAWSATYPAGMLRTLPTALGAAALGALALGAIAAVPAAASTPPGSTTPDPSELLDEPGTIVLGTSVEGRPIEAIHRADPDGDGSDAATVVVFGVIHGDEQAGRDIVARLGDLPLPDDVELYLVESMNPDGMDADRRTNANLVDLNRNFPYNWGPIAEPGHWEYAGPSAASEPETVAVVEFLSTLRPDLVIWYHQDAFMVAPADGREGELRAHYAELTGLPLESVTGGTYTGVAATWARHELASNEPAAGIAFIVELGATLSPDEADTHAAAVLTVANENL